MRIYMIRHGETDWNKARRVQGAADIPLNEYGIHLAKQTAEGLKDIAFDIAYTSPLIRARQTAEVVLNGRDVPLVDAEAIREMGFGEYEGMCISGEQKAPESALFNRFFTDTESYVPAKGGESVQEVLERTGRFLRELYADEALQDKTVLLSTHGAAMTALLNNIKGNLKTADFWAKGVPANCAVTIVDVKDGVPEITEENLIFYKEPVRQWSVEE